MLVLIIALPIFTVAQDVELDFVASGFSRPCEIVHAGDERLFVVEQGGQVHVLYTDGEVASIPFLDISDRVDANGGEKGLLGLAFPPDYCTSGVFYVNYTHTDNFQLYTRISRFAISETDPNIANEDSEEILMQFEQDFSNHNGGHIEFGPDGYLYIATGDGGSGGDPNNRAQDIMSFLGKILRIDVSTTPYTIPDDNPYAFVDFGLDEIWSYGLRNPWKFTFDSENGDMYIGDVGQSNREEVSFQAGGSAGGLNFGWRCYEGFEPYNTNGCALGLDYAEPIFDYAWGQSANGYRCAVTGGQVYRGPSFSALSGKYLFCDYCSPEYWLLWQENGEWQHFVGTGFQSGIVSFGTDVFGEMYAVKGSPGTVYRVLESTGELADHIQVVFGAEGATLSSPLDGADFEWYLDGNLIDGESGSTLSTNESGVYTLVITTEAGCRITTNPQDIVISSTNDHASVQVFHVFPNPSKDEIWIDVQVETSVGRQLIVNVFSIDGRLVGVKTLQQTEGKIQLDLASMDAGMYLVQLTDGFEVLGARKIVRQ